MVAAATVFVLLGLLYTRWRKIILERERERETFLYRF